MGLWVEKHPDAVLASAAMHRGAGWFSVDAFQEMSMNLPGVGYFLMSVVTNSLAHP